MLNRNFNPQPEFQTERLIIRALSDDDAENIFLIRSDREVNRYIDRDPCKSPDDALEFIHKIRSKIQNNESLYWAVCLKNNQLIGTTCLFNLSDEHESCEIGYELATDFHGKGFMQEALTATLHHALKEVGLKQISAVIHKDNERSSKLVGKFGFEKTDRVLPKHAQFFVHVLSKGT
jgi:ribosomal-protein-alanine N-acetyltransferase